jgi:predicted dehydrogenase
MGCASIAEKMMIPAILDLPNLFELKAVASRSFEKGLVFSDKFNTDFVVGYQELIERDDIDLIYMPLPTGLHEEWVMKSLIAGKHVLVEKSLAINFSSAKLMNDLAKEKGLLLLESFMFIHHSQHQWVKRSLESKEIGEIRLFRSQFGFPPLSYDNFRYNSDCGGGSLLDAGAYTVKASQLFLGSELKVINSVLYIDPKLKVDLFGNATLINERGIVAQISFGFDNYYQCNYEFWGSAGKLRAEKAFTPKPAEKPKMIIEINGMKDEVILDRDNHFVKLLMFVNETIRTAAYEGIINESLTQSRLLTEIQGAAIKIIL